MHGSLANRVGMRMRASCERTSSVTSIIFPPVGSMQQFPVELSYASQPSLHILPEQQSKAFVLAHIANAVTCVCVCMLCVLRVRDVCMMCAHVIVV